MIHGKFAKNNLEFDYQNTLKTDHESNLNTKNFVLTDISNKTFSSMENITVNGPFPQPPDSIDKTAEFNYTEKNIVSSIFYDNFKSRNFHHQETEEKTNIIPNLLYRKNKIKEDIEEKKIYKIEKINSLYYVFRDIFFILSPLISMIILIFLIIKCKKNNFSLRRKININESSTDFNNVGRRNYTVSNTKRNFSLENIVIKRESSKNIYLSNMDTADISVDEMSKMITDI